MSTVDIVEINDEQTYNAKLIASALSEPHKRKRGMIDILGINCAINYLQAKKVKISTQRSVYKIPLLMEEFKITDIYYNNYRIDVITLFKEKNIKIPKVHIDMDIVPHFYFVIQIGGKIKEAKIIGFIEGKSVLSCSHDSKYCYPNLNSVFDIEHFKELTRKSAPSKTLLGKHVDCMGLFLKFIDNDLSSIYKRQLIQHLMNCDSCRARFINTMEFEKLSGNIKFYPEIIKKGEIISTPLQQHLIEATIQKNHNLEESLKKVTLESLDNQDEVNQDLITIDKGEESSQDPNKPNTVEMFDLLDEDNKKQLNKNVIDTIFKEIPKLDLHSLPQIMTIKNRRIILSTILTLFIISSFALISYKNTDNFISEEQDSIEQMNEYNNSVPQENFNYDFENEMSNIAPSSDFNFKQTVTNNAPRYSPTIAKLSWEAPENLMKKDSYIGYLKSTGKSIKLTLQNELLLTNDIPTNRTAKVDIKISSNGNIENIYISQSSGSQSIDDSIIKVLGETLKYMKPPSIGILPKSSVITLVIDLK